MINHSLIMMHPEQIIIGKKKTDREKIYILERRKYNRVNIKVRVKSKCCQNSYQHKNIYG